MTHGRLAGFVLTMIAAPALGAIAGGGVLDDFLGFPPRPPPEAARSFHWGAFAVFSTGIVIALALLLHFGALRLHADRRAPLAIARFPWWGLLAAAGLGVSWVAAWNRFDLVAPVQPHTFTPLWLSFTVVLNAFCVARSGHSPMTDHPRWFLSLFPLSAAFWWYFEYLNRFTGNWSYVNSNQFDAIEYTVFATLAFSTVLPAVASMTALIGTQFRIVQPSRTTPCRERTLLSTTLLSASVGALFLVGLHPRWLFPLAWVAPGIAVVSFGYLAGNRRALDDLCAGDVRAWVLFPAAALSCGFFWEMWNGPSLAKWTYSIPLVHGFQIFEMPLLGYAGYLPFGIECLAAAQLATRSSVLDATCPHPRADR